MKRACLGLILAAVGCSEPIAHLQRSVPAAVLDQRHQSYSYSISQADRTVFVGFTNLRNEDGEPIHAFMRRLFASADSAEAVRLVIDLRSLTGSDARLLVPLIKGVATRARFGEAGGLYVLVGPNSFSPVQNAAKLLQQYANPVFVRGSSDR